MVPGIEPSPDKMLQGRLFSYPDTHRHRLGVNYQQIPVNCPYRTRGGVTNYHRDGFMAVNSNGGSTVNYEPNSFHGPKEDLRQKEHAFELKGVASKYRYTHPNDDFVQPKTLYEKVFDGPQKQRFIHNVVGSMKGVAPEREDIKIRANRLWYRVHPELGTKIAQGLGIDVTKIKSNM